MKTVLIGFIQLPDKLLFGGGKNGTAVGGDAHIAPRRNPRFVLNHGEFVPCAC